LEDQIEEDFLSCSAGRFRRRAETLWLGDEIKTLFPSFQASR